MPSRLSRYTRRAAIVAVALFAAAFVSVITIDLGPVVRAQAERAASARIERPVRIGRLGTYLLPGRFLVEDLVIEGLNPGDEPFLTSERIVVSTSWLAQLRGEILVDIVAKHVAVQKRPAAMGLHEEFDRRLLLRLTAEDLGDNTFHFAAVAFVDQL